jgi:hypothetical protein
MLDSLPTLRVVNSCFVNNSVSGFGTVVAFSGTGASESNNYGSSFAESLSCEFLAESDVVPVSEDQVTCTPFSANECAFDLAPGNATDGCWANTSEIFLDLKNRSESEEKVYHLCPQMEYNIAVKDENGLRLNGTDPLLATSNVAYICGFDGNPDDNCILRNGHEQVYSLGRVEDTFIDNVQFVGLTFTGAVRTIASFFKPGVVMFSRCRFQVRRAPRSLSASSGALSYHSTS